MLATRFGRGALQAGATWFDELIRRTETPCRSLGGACIRKGKSSGCFEIILLNADRRLAKSSERRAGLRRADPATLATSRSHGAALAHSATGEAATRHSRPLTAEARIACPTDIRRCIVRTDDFAFRAGWPTGTVATLASLAAGLVHGLTQKPAVMLPRRTIVAADRPRLRAAKPRDRAQWKTSLAVAVIPIAAAAGGIRAVAAGS